MQVEIQLFIGNHLTFQLIYSIIDGSKCNTERFRWIFVSWIIEYGSVGITEGERSRMSRQPQQSVDYGEEIDLIDYIKIILKYRHVVVGVVVFSALLTIFYKIQLPPAVPSFEANASLLVIPPPTKSELLPNFSAEVYQSLGKAQDLKMAIIDSLFPVDPPAVSLLDGMLEVEQQAGAGPIWLNLVVTSKDTNRFHPIRIANVWAELFVLKNQGLTSNEAIGSYSYINDQYLAAKENLARVESAITEFNQKNQIEFLQNILDIKKTKLADYQSSHINMSLQLQNLEKEVQEVDALIYAQETVEGSWIGDLEFADEPGVLKSGLTPSQMHLVETIAKVRNQLYALKQKERRYQFENDLVFEEHVLESHKTRLVTYLSELSRLNIDAESMKQMLLENNSKGVGDLGISLISSDNTDGMREFISLKSGYNLLETRKLYLVQEIDRLQTQTDSLRIDFSQKSDLYRKIRTKLMDLEENYQLLLSGYNTLKKRSVELKLSIYNMVPDEEFYRQQVELLKAETVSLKSQIAKWETEQTRLTREKDIHLTTFGKFSKLLEDARIAKAGQPEDVKVVEHAVSMSVSYGKENGISVFLILVAGFVAAVLVPFVIEYCMLAHKRLRESNET